MPNTPPPAIIRTGIDLNFYANPNPGQLPTWNATGVIQVAYGDADGTFAFCEEQSNAQIILGQYPAGTVIDSTTAELKAPDHEVLHPVLAFTLQHDTGWGGVQWTCNEGDKTETAAIIHELPGEWVGAVISTELPSYYEFAGTLVWDYTPPGQDQPIPHRAQFSSCVLRGHGLEGSY